MFKSYADAVIVPSFGRAAPTALLTSALIAPPAAPAPLRRAPDLSQDIGSARWWREAAALLALTGTALALWPGFAPLAATPAVRSDTSRHDELRSQMIAPLALGGDSGRRMAATTAMRAARAAPLRAVRSVQTMLAPGADLAEALSRLGVESGDARRVMALISEAVDPARLAPGTRLALRFGPEGLHALDVRVGLALAIAVERGRLGLTLNRTPIAVDDTPLRIRGTVGSSLYRSARAAGAPASAIQAYLQVLGQQVDLDNGLLPTDTFDIVIKHRRAATGEREIGTLLYAGIDRDARPRVQMVRWGDQFYEASGVGEQRSGLVAPVAGRLTSHFGMRRHPVLGFVRMHAGIDFAARAGTPIVAVTDGMVTAAGRMGGCGIAVRIDHGGGLQTRYCHMSQMAAQAGQIVRRGEVIGYVGSTGLSTGPHLHYEMYRSGRPVNPAEVSFVTHAQIAGSDLVRFRRSLAAIKAVTPGAALANVSSGETADGGAAIRREIDRIGA